MGKGKGPWFHLVDKERRPRSGLASQSWKEPSSRLHPISQEEFFTCLFVCLFVCLFWREDRERVLSQSSGEVVGRRPGDQNLGALTGTEWMPSNGKTDKFHKRPDPRGPTCHCYRLLHFLASFCSAAVSRPQNRPLG